VTTVQNGFFAHPLEGFVRNAPLAEVQAAAAAFLPTDRTVRPLIITFVSHGDTLALFDAGNGLTPAGATAGRMTANLAAAGIDPARVARMIQRHFHGEQVNGLLHAVGGRAFPNAQVLVPEPDWAWRTIEANQTRSTLPPNMFVATQRDGLRFAPADWSPDV
jgi:hypothetical protein